MLLGGSNLINITTYDFIRLYEICNNTNLGISETVE